MREIEELSDGFWSRDKGICDFMKRFGLGLGLGFEFGVVKVRVLVWGGLSAIDVYF